MRPFRHPRSRVFRGLLMLALLAWVALAFDVMAHPPAMADATEGTAGMAMHQASPGHCDDMTPGQGVPAGDASASLHVPTGGHGCCTFGHCHCASFCNGVVAAPGLIAVWFPMHDPVRVAIHAEPVPTATAPPFRPPIR